MTKISRIWLAVMLCAATLNVSASNAQAPQAPPVTQAPIRTMSAAPQSSVAVDGSEAMFTTMCALLAAGFESNVSSAGWTPYRAQMREKLQHQEGPAVEALRQYYREHELRDAGTMLSRYLWFGLVSGPAPKFQLTLRRDELPPEVLVLEGFSDILAAYYQEQNIRQLWRQVQPIYAHEIEQMHDSISQIVFNSSGYLRQILDPADPRTFYVIVEPLVGRITNVRNFGDHYAIVLSGSQDIPTDIVRHAFLHFLLDPLPLMYRHVVAVKRPVFDKAALAPRLDPELKDDFESYFAECTVRAVELKLKKMSPGERDAAMDRADADGYVLVRPIFVALRKFEESEPSMRLFFPDLVRSIDLSAEVKRVASIKFADATPPSAEGALTAEESARRRSLQPTTVPNDPEAIAALTEGEKKIAERNPRAAEVAFQKVLARYPDQIRAWYGLGMVALIDHDAPRAKQVFGRLTIGEHAATQDPMVMAWSHIYLARIYDDEGQVDLAKSEYQAALLVQGGPDQAQQAARRGLSAFGTEKPAERP